MVFSDELGYDPDEWEECPPADHFLVFSPFTRLVLSLSAIGCAVLFFWLVDQNKSKGGAKREEEETQHLETQVTPSESTQSGDLLSTITSLFTGRGSDPDFVQRSFRDEEKSPIAARAAAAAREQLSKIEVRPDELSSSFHYKQPEETRTAAEVRAEVDQAAFELRDLLDETAAPPIPPHRSFLPEVAQPLSDLAQQTQQRVVDAAERAKDYADGIQLPNLSGASDSARDAFQQASQQAAGVFNNMSDAARDAFDRASASVTDAFNRAEPLASAQQYTVQTAEALKEGAREAYDRAGDVIQQELGQTSQPSESSYPYDQAGLLIQDGSRQVEEAAQTAFERVSDAFSAQPTINAPDAYERAQAAASHFTDPDTARLEDDFERVQRDLDNLMAEHQVPLGVIIPGSSTSSTPAVSSSRFQQTQQATSPIDDHVRQLTSGLLTSDGEQKHSDIPSLHDIYEERQRQMSPSMGSPVKIPTMEDRAALALWEEELARKEQEKLSKLVDTIVGGDDISDIAASEGTEHLLPADHISMYSQDSARRIDDNESLLASEKINQKIGQISSGLEQTLLSEIEQLARQTSTMQAELARARDSEYSADEISEGVRDPHMDAFQPAGDVRFIPANDRVDQPAPISHRSSERQSGESDDFVKITPPSHSGAPSPSPALVCMSSSEEEQLKRLVEEYDVIGSTSTLKKDASAPGALSSGQQEAPPLPSPTTAALLQEYENVQKPPLQQQHEFHTAKSAGQLTSPQEQTPPTSRISAEEQYQLDQVLRDFELTPGSGRKDVEHRATPRTPPHTPENTLMDPFGRPIDGTPEEETAHFMTSGEIMSPTTEMTFPLAPRRSIGDLKKHFPRLPSEVTIEVVDPASAHLPKDAILPSDLEDVLASLVNVDTNELFLPSQQPPDSSIAAAAHAAATQLEQLETPILSGPTPDQSKKESADSPFNERKPTVVAPQASLDLSQPLQPPMAAFDRPDGTTKPTIAVNASIDMRQPASQDDPYAAISTKPQLMPAFDAKVKVKPAAQASATIPHEELEKADAIFQDALDYMHAQKQPSKEAHPQHATGFIMEEEMLSSHGENVPRRVEKSADGTSKLIKTNEIFERLDPHDDHDDMTYAPEIQSVEIPPDQLSETSELPHDDLPIDDDVYKSPEAQKLEAEIRAQESAMDEAKNVMQHRAALAQAPHIISMNSKHPRFPSTPSISSAKDSPKALRKQSSLLSILGVTSTQEMLLKIDSLEALSNAMRKAGLESTNVIFGIDYTASNKYQGEESFGGHSLHTIHPNLKNPYQQVITILGRTLAPFTTTGSIPVYGFGDAKTSDWSVFSLKDNGHCTTLEEVLKTYNEITPTIELSGPTNFSPLIYQAIEICQRTREYHILVIIADGQVTNEKATRRAIVQACQYPLSIIVVGVGDGPWDMMRVFDESLPKRPWDNFHFVEFHEVVKRASGAVDGDVKVAIQSLLEIPDQYRCICNLGLLKGRSPSISHKNK